MCVSSFREPYSGWVKGFRIADPLFMAYGKGFLPDCPGDPEGLIGLVPVDHVVNAILACGVLGRSTPEVFHLAYSEQSLKSSMNFLGSTSSKTPWLTL